MRPAPNGVLAKSGGHAEQQRRLAEEPAGDRLPPGSFPARVLSAAGVTPMHYRRAPLERRTAACLRALRIATVAEAQAKLAKEAGPVDTALNAFLIGVSSFFRDPAVFEAITAQVLPRLAGTGGPIRVCSVGCSSGEEIYSVAMLLAEAGLLDRAELVGTDCRPDAVHRARRGIFAAEATAQLPRSCRRYLERRGGAVQVVDALRERISWMVADVTTQLPSGAWDLALCRNLVIYLTPPAGKRLLTEVAGRIAPGGVLVVGKAERPPTELALIPIARCLYRRRDA